MVVTIVTDTTVSNKKNQKSIIFKNIIRINKYHTIMLRCKTKTGVARI